MKTTEQTRRELFEAHVKTANPDDYAQDGDRLFQWNGASYAWTWVNWDWLLWNAALDAVVIELPAERHVRSGWQEAAGADMAFNDCRELCVDAIESTNLGLKIR